MHRRHLFQRSDGAFGIFMFLILFYSVGASSGEPLISRFAEGLVSDPFLVGILISLSWITYTITAEPAGTLVSKIGERKSVLFGGVLDSIGFLMIYFSSSVYIFALAMIVEGFGSIFFWSATRTHIANISKKKTGKAFGFYTACWSFGWAFGPMVGGILAVSMGIRAPFVLSSVILLIITFVFMRSMPKDKTQVKKSDIIYELEGGFIKEGIKFLKTCKPGVKRTLLLQMFMYASLTVVMTFFPLYFISLSHAEIGVMFFMHAIIFGISGLLWGYLADKYPKKWFALIGFFLSGIAIAALTDSFNSITLLFFMGSIGVTFALAEPTLVALLNDNVTRKTKGIANGISLSAMGLGASIGPITAGYVASSFGIGWAFTVSTLLCFIAVFVAATIRN